MDRKKHWERVYADKLPQQASWFQVRPSISLDLIARTGAAPDEGIIDVGAGASTLVDNLLASGHTDLTVLDISATALAVTKSRLGKEASSVEFVETDLMQWKPARQYQVWHDRAAFHFLIDAVDRARYVETLKQGLAPGGQAIIGTFSTDGPRRCSNLDIVQYDESRITAALGPAFEYLDGARENHVTPWGSDQQFLWSRFRRSA